MMLLLLDDASSKALPMNGHPIRDFLVQDGSRENLAGYRKRVTTFGSWRRLSTFHAQTFGDGSCDLIEGSCEKWDPP